jgi:hypothetical protein
MPEMESSALNNSDSSGIDRTLVMPRNTAMLSAWHQFLISEDFSSKESSPSARRSYGPVFMRIRGHSRNVFVYCVLSRTYGNPANPVRCSKH